MGGKMTPMVGGGDPAYGHAQKARMILITLLPWLKGLVTTPKLLSINELLPPSKNCGTSWSVLSTSVIPLGPIKGGALSPLEW